MSAPFAESLVEQAALDILGSLGWTIAHGGDLAPDLPGAERETYQDVVLVGRLRDALSRLSPSVPGVGIDEAVRRLLDPPGSTVEARNRAFHEMLVSGVAVEYPRDDGSIKGDRVRVIDAYDAAANEWLAVNQYTIVENKRQRRPDILLFVNGLPIGIVELKSAADEKASVWTAYQQIQTYKSELTTLFAYNEIIVVSDGVQARMGTLTAGKEWFKPWRTVDGDQKAAASQSEMGVLLRGILDPARLLDLLQYFLVFEDVGGGKLVKKVAGYHQFHAVNVAIEETKRAARELGIASKVAERTPSIVPSHPRGGDAGDRRVGVVWHTQGSGKSLTMAFYAGRVVADPEMANPTVVVITDRNDLDDQLFGTFSRCHDLLRQMPVQAQDRGHLRQLLRVQAGGVVFTTIQKFMPEEKGDRHPQLSDRRNIVVMADEAHRSQYDFIDGFAAHLRDALPGAAYIGFTGTPIELSDKNTRAVFGNYISVYDIQRAVDDQATVPIYYESRLAQLGLDESAKPRIDPDFEEVTEGEEVERKERLKSKWAQLEAVVGASGRLKLIAKDLVDHFEERDAAIRGKAMVVCMSRRICVELYREIVALRPAWHGAEDEEGMIKVVMTGSASDPLEWQPHIRNKSRLQALGSRFRDPEDPFRIVIVRDMWLTGFDAPSLHTMYVDKPMRGHGLMQAIARVNRVFADKPGGLVVDYLGLAQDLKEALAVYTESGGTGDTAVDQGEAVAVLLEKYEVCCGIFHGFDWGPWTTGTGEERLELMARAVDHVLGLAEGRERLVRAVRELSQAFALSVPNEAALRIRDDVAFFQAVRALLIKGEDRDGRTQEDLDLAVRQIVSRAVVSEGVVDIFKAAGLERPDISILSDDFLAEVKDLPHRNLAVELLQRLLKGEIRKRRQRNVVEGRSFAEMLEEALRRYQNRSVEAAQVIEELIELAKRLREAAARGEKLGLTDDELAFYDALEANDSAVAVMGDETLRGIARELVEKVRANVTIDWTIRENVRAKLRVLVKRILKKYGYPPDKQEKATATVLEQAEVLCEGWMGA
ncbi:MAG: type I restriction endonuclease subunit R [Planctomycetes bacterium]|nr:type I restriction endonuclease subunit R [Planctomycetota bacterium]